MANRNWASGGKIYSMHVMPVLLDCNFIVDSTNANGLGIRALKGPAIQAVYMHTTATPAVGNPNPEPGTIIIRLSDAYNRSFSGFTARISPTSGVALKVDNSALTAGTAYIITTLGTTTAAQWIALGVPRGVTPAVGVSFIAASVGAGANTSTSRVMTTAPLGTAIASVENVGDPTLTINPLASANQGYGGQLILQTRDYAGVVAAPADGSTIAIAMYLSNSSITVQGE